MKLLVAIPAFNESGSIAKVIEEVKEYIPDSTIVVIDDGSSDSTGKIAKSMGVTVLTLPFNLGVGGALRTAFKYAHRNTFTHLLQIDADGQHNPQLAKRLIQASEKSDIAIGSRFVSKEATFQTSTLRRIAMIWLSFLTSRFCKTKLTDVSSGFRISNEKAIELFARTYPTEYLGDTVESLIIASRNGLTISEVPIEMRYRTTGAPSQNFIKSSWYLLRATMAILFAALHSDSE